MNERDSEQVAQTFAERGYTLTPQEQDADAILINTCSVRDQAEQKALGKMGMMGKYRENRAHVVYGFMGCMAQSRGSELFERVPHLDLVVGTQKYHRVFDYVDSILSRRMETRMRETCSKDFRGRYKLAKPSWQRSRPPPRSSRKSMDWPDRRGCEWLAGGVVDRLPWLG